MKQLILSWITALVFGLTAALAVANDTIEISAGAENEAGDKLDIVVSGENIELLTGMAKIDCKEDGDQAVVAIVASQLKPEDICRIRLWGELKILVVIDICDEIPVMIATKHIDSSCTDGVHDYFYSGAKDLDLSIKVL